jgi:hypothetical protein
MDYSQSPFVDIKLPPPLYIISIVPLLAINIALLCFDYVLYSNEKKLRFLLSPTQLRFFTGTLHVLLPMFVISDQPQSNALFTTAPWLLAVYSASFPIDDQFKFTDYFNSLMQTTFEPKHKIKHDVHFTTLQIRQAGLTKAVRGVFKFGFLFLAVEPLLPPESRHILEFPWLNLTSLGFILLFGLKHYCLLGILDIAFGLEQMALAEFTIDSMHEPYLSTR